MKNKDNDPKLEKTSGATPMTEQEVNAFVASKQPFIMWGKRSDKPEIPPAEAITKPMIDTRIMTNDFMSVPMDERTPEFDSKTFEQIGDSYGESRSAYNELLWNKSEEEAKAKTNDPGNWYDAYSKIIREGDVFDWLSVPQWTIATLETINPILGAGSIVTGGIPLSISEKTFNVAKKFASAEANIKAILVGDIARFLDVADWRATNIIPTKQSAHAFYRDIIGTLKRHGENLEQTEFMQNLNASLYESLDETPQKVIPWSDEKWEQYNAETLRLREKGEATDFYGYLKTIDKAFEWLDDWIGDEETSNWVTTRTDRSQERRNIRTDLATEFALDNEVPYLGMDGANWTINNLVNTQTSLTAFAIEGMIPGGIFEKMKIIPQLVKGAKTVKEANIMIRVGNVLLKNKFTKGMKAFGRETVVPNLKIGISGAVPAGSEIGQIGRQTEREAQLIFADRYGGELWKQHWERIQQIHFRQARREGDERNVMSRMGEYKTKEMHRYFSTYYPEIYKKIITQSAHAARIAIKGNSSMYFLNFPFGMALNNMTAFSKRLRTSYKALAGGNIGTRAAAVKNLSIGKTMSGIVPEMFSESLIEEGWINPWGEWRGIAYAKGETLTGDKFADRLWEGEALEGMLWGAMGALMMGAPQAVSYRSNKKAYKHFMEKYSEYVEALPEDVKKALFDIVTSNSSSFQTAQLEGEIKQANARGEDTRALNALMLRSQALAAFKTGMTEELLKIYQQIASETGDADEKQAAQDIVTEILELEKIYIDTQKYEDNEAVFGVVADMKVTGKIALQNDMMIEELKATAVEQLEAGKKSFKDADYYFKEDGTLAFIGKDADAFRDRMLVKPKVEHVSRYNKAMLNNADAAIEMSKLQDQFNDVTSEQYQRDVRVAKEVERKVAKNFPDLFSSETGNEFRQKMNGIFQGAKLSKKRQAVLYKKYKNMYNGFKKSQQQNSMTPKGYVPIVSKNKLIHRKTQQTARKFTKDRKTKKDTNEDAAPIKVTSDDENYAKGEVNKWIDQRKAAGETDMSFKRMIRDYLGLDEKLNEDELASRKEDTEAMFDMLEYGWSQGGHGKTNGKAIYQEFFVEKFSTKNSLQRFRDKMKGRTSETKEEKKVVKAEPKETTSVEEELTEEESDIIEKETKEEIQEAVEAGEIINEEKEEATETVNNLGRYIRLKFKAFNSVPLSLADGLKTIKILRVKNSNIESSRLFNVKKFKKGARVALKISTESLYKIPIIYRINGKEQKFERTSKSDYGSFFENKYGRITHFRYGNTIVKIEGEGFSFSQTPTLVGKDGRLQDDVEYKSYDHREPGTVFNDEGNPNKRHHQHKVTDDFMIVDDGDFQSLNNPNVHEVRVQRIVNKSSKEGEKSYIELTIVDKDGNEGKLRRVEVENDKEQNMPMGAADDSDGAMIAWIDTYQTLLLDDKHDEATIRIAQKNIVAFRKDVVNGKKKSAAIHSNAPIGNPQFSEMEESTPISEQDPTATLGQRIRGVIRIGTEVFENKRRKIVNKDEILNENKDVKSLPIDIRFIGTDENSVELYAAFFAHGLEKGTKQDIVGSNNMLWVLRAYLTKFDTQGKIKSITPKMRKVITEKVHSITGGFPISDFRGVKEYLNNFTIMDVPIEVKTDKKMNKTKFMAYVNSSKVAIGQPVIMMNGPVVFYAIKGERIPTGGKNEDGSAKTTDMINIYLNEESFNANKIEMLLTSIEAKADSFKKNFNSEYSRTKGKIATFEKDGIVNEMDYTEYQRNNLTTNIKAFKETSGGETFYVTATNVSASIDTNQEGTPQAVAQTSEKKEEIIGLQMETLSEELPESKTTEEAIEDNKTPDEIKLLTEIRKALGLLGSKKVNKLFSTINLDEDFSLTKEALNTPAFFHTVPGVNPLQKEQVVLAVVNAIINSGEVLTKENVQEMINNGFINQIVKGKNKFQSLIDKLDALIESGSDIENLTEVAQEMKDGMKIFDTVEKNWKKFEDDIRVQLYKYAGLDENQAINELESHHEGQDRIFDKESTELINKNSLPEEMKKFFAGIENCYSDGTVINGFLGVPTYVPFDVAINIVTRIIGSNPKAGMTFADVVSTLSREKKAIPFLGNVISKLSDPEIMTEQMKNRFMTNMVKHNMSMQYVQYKYDRKKKRYELRVFDTNSSQVEKVIFREWMNGVKASKLVKVNEDSRHSIINKDEAQTLHTEFREIIESIKKDDKTNQFARWLTKNLVEQDYTKEGILKILVQAKKDKFAEQISDAIDRNLGENKTFSKTELVEWLSTSEFSNERLIKWLAKFNIVLSNRTVESLRDNGYTNHKGQDVTFASMFEESSQSSGVFGGIAYKLSEYINTSKGKQIDITEDTKMHPFRSIETSLKSLAKEEGRFSSRAVTISFRDAGKSYSGFVPPKFATDRIDELKGDTETRRNLKKDPFSSNSMLLNLLTGDYSGEIEELLKVVHIGGSAMRKAGESNPTGNENAIINLAVGDQEITRQGFFQDIRQGKISVNNTYNGIKLRIANMFFPTMSDKKQILTMTMPVLDLTSEDIQYENDKVQANAAVKEALFQQLVVPELKRIIAFHRNGGEDSNIEGVDLASQVFLMIPQLNELKIGKERLIANLAHLQDPEIAKTVKDDIIINNIRDDAVAIIMKVVTKETNNKVQNWKDSGIITPKGNPEMLNDEYFNPDDGTRRFSDNKSELAAADFVINSLISYSNMFQTVAGDIAFYSQDEAFSKFPVDAKSIEGFKEITGIEYGDVMNEIETLYNMNKIGKTAYEYLKKTVRPLPFIGDNEQAYIDLTKNIGANLGKRLALMLAPGLKPYGLSSNYRQLFLKDSVDIADNMEHIVELHYGENGVKRFNEIMDMNTTREGKEGLIKDEFPTISSFFAIDSTDAQEYTTAKEHLDILFALGRISEEEHKDFTAKAEDQYHNGVTSQNELKDDELRLIFQPMKPVYTGSHFDGKRMRMMYIKTSAYPLLPQVTADFPQLESLRKVMDEMQYGKELGGMNVRATYKTGAKVGATIIKVDPFAVDNKGNLTIEKLTSEELEQSTVTLDRNNFRIQQDVPFHALGSEEKTSVVSIGTQLMKLLFGDGVTDIQGFQYGKGPLKSGRELLDIYNETFGELTDHLKQELYDELGLNPNGQPLDHEYFMLQLSSMLQREAKKRNYPQQDIDALEIIDVSGKEGKISGFVFRNPLWMSSNSMRYESLLNSLITNKLIKLKMPGYAYVAGSQKGFETAHKVKDKRTASRIIYTKHYNAETGLIAARKGKKAQILIPSRFRNRKGELIDLFKNALDKNGNDTGKGRYIKKVDGVWKLKDKMIAEELLDITSFRIPTSSHVSASQVEIAGFLPPEAGDLMIVPKEFAVQKGLDYDIDKEFSYNLWHATDDKGRIVALNEHIDIDQINHKLGQVRNELAEIRTGDANFYKKLKEIESLPEDESNSMLEKAVAAMLNGTKYRTATVTDVVMKVKALQKIKKKFLENEIVKIHSAVIGSNNPEVQRRINKVLSMVYASQQAEELQDTDAEFNTLLSDEYQTKKMNLGAVGQMAISVYSNFVVFNSLLQQSSSDISINVGDTGLTIGNHSSDGKLGRYTNILSSNTIEIITDIINSKKGLQSTKDAQITKLKDGSLTYYEISEIVKDTRIFIDEEGNRVSEKEGGIEVDIMDSVRTTSEAFAERQNTATDNEKEQILGRVGVNSGTINVDSILTLLGFDKGEYVKDADGQLVVDKARKPVRMSIAYLLISQPIVKEYIKRKQNRTAKTNKIFSTNEEMLAELIDEFGGIDSLKTDDLLTSQNMYDAAKNGIDNGIQLNALFMFLKIDEYGKSLNTTQQLLGITKNGLDKSLFNTAYLYELLSNVAYDENFKNITDLIGDFKFGKEVSKASSSVINEWLVAGYVSIGDVFVKPTTMMGHLIVKGIMTGHALAFETNMGQPLFPYTNDSVKYVMNEIMEMTRATQYGKKEAVEFKNTMMQGIRKFINSGQEHTIINGDIEGQRRRLFLEHNDAPSLAAYLENLKTSKNNVITINYLLNDMLQYNPSNNDGISTIFFDNSADNAFNEENVYAAFENLLSDPQALPDNKAISDENILPDEKGDLYMEQQFVLTPHEIESMENFDKQVIITANNMGMQKGETKIFKTKDNNSRGDRYKVTYLGKITKSNYNGNFTLDSGQPKNRWTQQTKEFDAGQEKSVFRIEPVYTTVELAQDLTSYSFLSGGVQGPIEFGKYIPLRMLEEMGYTDNMKDIDITDDVIIGKLLGMSTGVSNFVIQFFQHNPDTLPRFTRKKLGLLSKNVNEINTIPEELVPKIENFDGTKTPHPMFTIKNIAENNHNVYIYGEYMDNKKVIRKGYIRLPQVGVHGMSEYDSGKVNVNSILNKNVRPIQIVSMLPETTESSDIYGISSNSPKTVLQSIAVRNDSLGALAKVLIPLNDGELTVGVDKLVGKDGTYNPTPHHATIDSGVVFGENNHKQAEIFLHEYLHGLTSRELNEYFDHEGNFLRGVTLESLPEYVRDLYSMFLDAKDIFGITDEKITQVRTKRAEDETLTPEEFFIYGFSNVKEFVTATMTEETFRDRLRSQAYNDTNFFDKFTKIIKDMIKALNPNADNTMLDAVSGVILNMVVSEAVQAEVKQEETSIETILNIAPPIKSDIMTPETTTLHSGGAEGADTLWGAIGEEFGVINQNHYRHGTMKSGNVTISETDFQEGRVKAAQAAKMLYGYKYSAMKDSRLIRNWSQVKYSDAVFAISNILEKGDKYSEKTSDTRIAENQIVAGGTGYAVAMAIQAGKPVHVYHQGTRGSKPKGWYTWNGTEFISTEIPTLTQNFAGVGSRNITKDGRQAIEDVYKKTFDEKQTLETTFITMQPDNITKIKAGTKSTTIRSKSQADKIGIPIGETKTVIFGGVPFLVTNRGELTIDEAGGAEAMITSEDVGSIEGFKFQQTKSWIQGKGKLFVYDINPISETLPATQEVQYVDTDTGEITSTPPTKPTPTPVPKIVEPPTGKKEFTYEGNTIETEFPLGAEQQQALTSLLNYALGKPSTEAEKAADRANVMTLEGSAGTGKTTIIGYLQKMLQKNPSLAKHLKVTYAAPTHAATVQLGLTTVKLGNTSLPATIRSAVYEKFDRNTGRKQWVFTKKMMDRIGKIYSPILVVDESSMLTQADIDHLREAVNGIGGKLILMGDIAQIPAVIKNVTQKDVSPAFELPKVILDKVYRQEEGPLLRLLTKIRSNISYHSYKTKFHESIQILSHAKYAQSLVEDMTSQPEDTIIIDYTNKGVKSANKDAREILGNSGEPKVGEQIIGYGGNNTKQIETGDIANSVKYTIEKIEKKDDGTVTITAKSSLLEGLADKFDIPKTAKNKYIQLSSTDSFNFELTEEQLEKNNKLMSKMLADVVVLKQEIDELAKQKAWGTFYDKQADLNALLTEIGKHNLGDNYVYDVSNNKMVKYDYKLHGKIPAILRLDKGIDFGYAITIHKSQGITMKNVYFNMDSLNDVPNVKIMMNGKQINTEKNTLYYVAMSRASEKVVINENNTEFTDTFVEEKTPASFTPMKPSEGDITGVDPSDASPEQRKKVLDNEYQYLVNNINDTFGSTNINNLKCKR